MLQVPACGQCGRFSLPAEEKLVEHGFGRCHHLPVWQWRSASAAPCAFTPTRFEARNG